MPEAELQDVTLYFESHGPENAPVIVMVNGFSQPLPAWPKGLVQGLVAAGYRVVVFDNRDIGRSSQMHHLGKANLPVMMLKKEMGLGIKAPYGLGDMANDVIALMDHLQIGQCHLIGASMGGMICQHIAAKHADRVLSLTSIMSSSGAKGLPQADKDVLSLLYSAPPQSETEKNLLHAKKLWRAIGSKTWPVTAEKLEKQICHFATWGTPTDDGIDRQFAAILSDQERPGILSKITAPTLVLHGNEDGLLPPGCGLDTASRITGARFLQIDGMGHDFPDPLIDTILALILDQVGRATLQNKHEWEMKEKVYG